MAGDAGSPVGAEDLSAWIAREGAAQVLRAFVLRQAPDAAVRVPRERLSARRRDELAVAPGSLSRRRAV
ncbi:hypothetical protein GCM10020256_70440 [Streptomyces thermocoprophilus]